MSHRAALSGPLGTRIAIAGGTGTVGDLVGGRYYNEHLIHDVGDFYLAFTILFAWAAWRPSRDRIPART